MVWTIQSRISQHSVFTLPIVQGACTPDWKHLVTLYRFQKQFIFLLIEPALTCPDLLNITSTYNQGWIQSPNYPLEYGNSLNCTWQITMDSVNILKPFDPNEFIWLTTRDKRWKPLKQLCTNLFNVQIFDDVTQTALPPSRKTNH